MKSKKDAHTHPLAEVFGFPADDKGDFLMTYDNAGEVQRMAMEYGFETRAIPMKNTHHAELDELLIGRDLTWADMAT